jgi:Protein of unknown function VcgC/VcgE (DUF2780)
MADITTELASKCGISPEQAQKGLGAVLAFLKKTVPAETYAKISAAVPGAEEMTAAAETGQEASGGILGAIGDLAGKLVGGSAAAALVGQLTKLGFTPEQIQMFLPKVLEFLKGKVPDETLKQISAAVPAPEPAAQ